MTAEAVEQTVAVGMRRDGLLAQATLVDEPLDHGMVARAREDLAAADEIETAVADMGPEHLAFLHQARDKHRARRLQKALLARLAQNRGMPRGARPLQEGGRVRQRLARLRGEARAQDVGRDLRGELAVHVAAEAVGDRQQRRLRRLPVADAILVGLARPENASFDDLHRATLFATPARSAAGAGDRAPGTTRPSR